MSPERRKPSDAKRHLVFSRTQTSKLSAKQTVEREARVCECLHPDPTQTVEREARVCECLHPNPTQTVEREARVCE